MDPFATLGIPRSYDVDLPMVEKRHRELSRAMHPDKFLGGGATERRAALAKAVEINEAWRIVRDPIRRAEALLRLAGAPVGEEGEPKADPELLMEMLELREELADAKQAHDRAAVGRMARTVEQRSREVERALGEGFARSDPSCPEGLAALVRLVGDVGKLRFFRRFLDEVAASDDEALAPPMREDRP